jgi:hypothetical protein
MRRAFCALVSTHINRAGTHLIKIREHVPESFVDLGLLEDRTPASHRHLACLGQ